MFLIFTLNIKSAVLKIGICYGMTPISVTDRILCIDNRDFHDIVNAFVNVLNNNPRNVYIYIISYSKSISHKECHFFLQKSA